MRHCELFASFEVEGMGREGGGMGLDELFAAHEEWGTRLEEQVVKLEGSITWLEEQGMRLAAELSGSAGAVGFFDN